MKLFIAGSLVQHSCRVGIVELVCRQSTRSTVYMSHCMNLVESSEARRSAIVAS